MKLTDFFQQFKSKKENQPSSQHNIREQGRSKYLTPGQKHLNH